MTDPGYVHLREHEGGAVVVTLFAPEVTPDGLRAPSLCAHRPVTAGTILFFDTHKLESPELQPWMNRAAQAFFFRSLL